MYILDYIEDQFQKKSSPDGFSVEYRLVCSGELYNKSVIAADWRKSDITRILLEKPFEMYVTSIPFNDYPQELALRFDVNPVTISEGNYSQTFSPDVEIAEDFTALLSLFSRRLVTVGAKVREIYKDNISSYPKSLLNRAYPFINSVNKKKWDLLPLSILYNPEGKIEVNDYNPEPKGIIQVELEEMFNSIQVVPHSENFISSVRLYKLALELIQTQPDISYNLLILSIESIDNKSLNKFKPDKSEMIKTKESVYKKAIKCGLSDKEAEIIAIEACKGLSWTSKKFKKFIIDYISEDFWDEDDLFKISEMFLPKKTQLESSLEKIYQSR